MAYKTEKTVPNVSVGADTEQSSQKCTVLIITDFSFNFNSFDENGKEVRPMSELKIIGMDELPVEEV